MAQVGKSYVYGAAGPSAFDCSGLTMMAWAQAGVGLPHSSGAQMGSGTPVSQSELQPGDLVFYYSPVSHVGMYIGNGQIVNALNPGAGVGDLGRQRHAVLRCRPPRLTHLPRPVVHDGGRPASLLVLAVLLAGRDGRRRAAAAAGRRTAGRPVDEPQAATHEPPRPTRAPRRTSCSGGWRRGSSAAASTRSGRWPRPATDRPRRSSARCAATCGRCG